MLMPPFELHKPTSVEEACEIAAQLLESGQEFDWIAGGTDIIPNSVSFMKKMVIVEYLHQIVFCGTG